MKPHYTGIGGRAEILNSIVLLPFLIVGAIRYQSVWLAATAASFAAGLYFSWRYGVLVTAEWRDHSRLGRVKVLRNISMFLTAFAFLSFWVAPRLMGS